MRTFTYVYLLFFFILFSACATGAPKIIKVESSAMPLVRAALYFPFGSGDEASGEEGATLVLTKWMDYGTKKYPSMSSFNQALLANGAVIDTTVYPRFTIVTVEAPSERFLDSWSLTVDKIRNARFAESDLALVKDNLISQKRSRLNTWSTAGRQFANAVVYAGTKEARLEFGTEAGLKSISKERLAAIYADRFAKGPAAILATQSLSKGQEAAIEESTKDWGSSFTKIESNAVEQKGRRIIIVERPGSTQAFLFFVKNGPTPGTEDHALTSIGTQILGSNGGNASLLFDELRAKRGLTYHASMQTSKLASKQWIVGVTFGANEKVAELTGAYTDVWQKFYADKTISAETLQEADMAYRAIRERENGSTMADIIKAAAETFSVTGSTDPVWEAPQVTKALFEKAKRKWLSPDSFTLIVLGDSAKVRGALEAAVKPTLPTKVLPAESDWDSVSEAVSTP